MNVNYERCGLVVDPNALFSGAKVRFRTIASMSGVLLLLMACVCMCVRMRVCVCMCVCERERESSELHLN